MTENPDAAAYDELTSPDSRAYWDGLRRGKVVFRRCHACGRAHLPPLPGCPHCGQPGDLVDEESAGLGVVYSWVVAYYAFDEASVGTTPYVIAAVDLDEGPRAFGRMERVAVDASLAGLRVHVAVGGDPSVRLPALIFTPLARREAGAP
jgi:uncharacterized OB-fold protein